MMRHHPIHHQVVLQILVSLEVFHAEFATLLTLSTSASLANPHSFFFDEVFADETSMESCNCIIMYLFMCMYYSLATAVNTS